MSEKERLDNPLPETQEGLRAECLKLREKIIDVEWAADKTNEGVRVLYKELSKKNEELHKLDQLKTDFVATVSHELRTPLTIIREGVSLIQDGILGATTADQNEILGDVIQNIDRLANIINDLLDISKLEAGNIKLNKLDIEVKPFIDRMIAAFQVKIKSSEITLEFEYQGQDFHMYGDPGRLIQVLTNLIGNASKFTPKGGKITVRAFPEDNYIRIEIKDTGCGIAQEDLPKVFGKFQQFGRTDGPGEKGTGLGLAISKRIVEMHEGIIGVDSILDQGTTFYFLIPKYKTHLAMSQKLLNESIQRMTKESEEPVLSIAMVNVLNLFEIRSLYGDDTYDEVISKIMEIAIRNTQHAGDQVVRSRLGQIMIVLPATDKKGASTVCQRLRKSIETHPIRCGGKRLDIKVEFGVATYPDNGMSSEELTSYADDKIIEGHNVLIVDDHPQIIGILKRRIESRGGFKCSSACDGESALKAIAENPPDLIITDIMMPNMSGYELIGRLKENSKTRNIPVIILTAHAVKMERMKSIYPGSVPVISKTDGFDKLIDLVDTLI